MALSNKKQSKWTLAAETLRSGCSALPQPMRNYILMLSVLCIANASPASPAVAKDWERLADGRVVIDIQGHKIALIDSPFDRKNITFSFASANSAGYDDAVKAWHKKRHMAKFHRRHKNTKPESYEEYKRWELRDLDKRLQRGLTDLGGNLGDLLDNPAFFRQIFVESRTIGLRIPNYVAEAERLLDALPRSHTKKFFLGKYDIDKIGYTNSYDISFTVRTRGNATDDQIASARTFNAPRTIPAHAKREADGFYLSKEPFNHYREPIRYYLPVSGRLKYSLPSDLSGGMRPFYDPGEALVVFSYELVFRSCYLMHQKKFLNGRTIQTATFFWKWNGEYFPRATFKERDLLFRQLIDHVYVTKNDGAVQ